MAFECGARVLDMVAVVRCRCFVGVLDSLYFGLLGNLAELWLIGFVAFRALGLIGTADLEGLVPS